MLHSYYMNYLLSVDKNVYKVYAHGGSYPVEEEITRVH